MQETTQLISFFKLRLQSLSTQPFTHYHCIVTIQLMHLLIKPSASRNETNFPSSNSTVFCFRSNIPNPSLPICIGLCVQPVRSRNSFFCDDAPPPEECRFVPPSEWLLVCTTSLDDCACSSRGGPWSEDVLVFNCYLRLLFSSSLFIFIHMSKQKFNCSNISHHQSVI